MTKDMDGVVEELKKRFSENLGKKKPCEQAVFRLGMLMMAHNINDLGTLIDIQTLANSLIHYNKKTGKHEIHESLMQMFKKGDYDN